MEDQQGSKIHIKTFPVPSLRYCILKMRIKNESSRATLTSVQTGRLDRDGTNLAQKINVK